MAPKEQAQQETALQKRLAEYAAKNLSGKPLEVLVGHSKYECQVYRYVELKNRLLDKYPPEILFVKDNPAHFIHSFEVKVNGQLVHSRLKAENYAYPDFDDLIKIVDEVYEGKGTRPCKLGETYNPLCRVY